VEARRWEPGPATPRVEGSTRAPLWIAAGVGALAGVAVTWLLMPPPAGRVAFALEPPHAEVALLAAEGRRPLAGGPGGVTSVLGAGPHRAEVSAPGFASQTVEFEVASGELRKLEVRLAPALGRVSFESLPERARLEVIAQAGGEPLELPLVEGAWSGELEVGAWVARASAPGYQEQSVSFEVVETPPTRLEIRLRAIPRTARRAPASAPDPEPEMAHEAAVVPVPVPVPAPAPYWAPGYYGPRFGPRPPRPPGPRPPFAPRPPRPPFP
jgi:hypothetical protein